jgi:hypothetical protein
LLRQNNAKKLKDGCKSIKASRAYQLKKPPVMVAFFTDANILINFPCPVEHSAYFPFRLSCFSS